MTQPTPRHGAGVVEAGSGPEQREGRAARGKPAVDVRSGSPSCWGPALCRPGGSLAPSCWGPRQTGAWGALRTLEERPQVGRRKGRFAGLCWSVGARCTAGGADGGGLFSVQGDLLTARDPSQEP